MLFFHHEPDYRIPVNFFTIELKKEQDKTKFAPPYLLVFCRELTLINILP